VGNSEKNRDTFLYYVLQQLVVMFPLLPGTNPLGLFKDTLAGELDTVAAIVKCIDVVLVSVVQTDVTFVFFGISSWPDAFHILCAVKPLAIS
jgi:hypothetical protein